MRNLSIIYLFMLIQFYVALVSNPIRSSVLCVMCYVIQQLRVFEDSFVLYILTRTPLTSSPLLSTPLHSSPLYSPLPPSHSLTDTPLYSRKREVQLAVNLVSKLSSYTPTDVAAFTEKTRTECAELSGTEIICSCSCTLTYSNAEHIQLSSLPSIHPFIPSIQIYSTSVNSLTHTSLPSYLPSIHPSTFHISHLTLHFTISIKPSHLAFHHTYILFVRTYRVTSRRHIAVAYRWSVSRQG